MGITGITTVRDAIKRHPIFAYSTKRHALIIASQDLAGASSLKKDVHLAKEKKVT